MQRLTDVSIGEVSFVDDPASRKRWKVLKHVGRALRGLVGRVSKQADEGQTHRDYVNGLMSEISDYLERTGPRSLEDVCDQTGEPQGEVSPVLAYMRDQGAISESLDGLWSLRKRLDHYRGPMRKQDASVAVPPVAQNVKPVEEPPTDEEMAEKPVRGDLELLDDWKETDAPGAYVVQIAFDPDEGTPTDKELILFIEDRKKVEIEDAEFDAPEDGKKGEGGYIEGIVYVKGETETAVGGAPLPAAFGLPGEGGAGMEGAGGMGFGGATAFPATTGIQARLTGKAMRPPGVTSDRNGDLYAVLREDFDGEATVQDLALWSGWDEPAVRAVVDDLVADGMVIYNAERDIVTISPNWQPIGKQGELNADILRMLGEVGGEATVAELRRWLGGVDRGVLMQAVGELERSGDVTYDGRGNWVKLTALPVIGAPASGGDYEGFTAAPDTEKQGGLLAYVMDENHVYLGDWQYYIRTDPQGTTPTHRAPYHSPYGESAPTEEEKARAVATVEVPDDGWDSAAQAIQQTFEVLAYPTAKRGRGAQADAEFLHALDDLGGEASVGDMALLLDIQRGAVIDRADDLAKRAGIDFSLRDDRIRAKKQSSDLLDGIIRALLTAGQVGTAQRGTNAATAYSIQQFLRDQGRQVSDEELDDALYYLEQEGAIVNLGGSPAWYELGTTTAEPGHLRSPESIESELLSYLELNGPQELGTLAEDVVRAPVEDVQYAIDVLVERGLLRREDDGRYRAVRKVGKEATAKNGQLQSWYESPWQPIYDQYWEPIRELLGRAARPMKPEEIADLLGADPYQIGVVLREMISRGTITRDEIEGEINVRKAIRIRALTAKQFVEENIAAFDIATEVLAYVDDKLGGHHGRDISWGDIQEIMRLTGHEKELSAHDIEDTLREVGRLLEDEDMHVSEEEWPAIMGAVDLGKSMSNPPEVLDYAMGLAEQYADGDGVVDDSAMMDIWDEIQAEYGDQPLSGWDSFVKDLKWWAVGAGLYWLVFKQGGVTPAAAKEAVASILEAHGYAGLRLTAKAVSFQDLARGSAIVVTVHDWEPNPDAAAIKAEAPEGVVIEFETAVGKQFFPLFRDPERGIDDEVARLAGGGGESETAFAYHIDLDERGEFRAHVDNAKDEVVFEIEGTDIFDEGWMRNKEDIAGLEEYLRQLGVIGQDDQVVEKAVVGEKSA